MAQKASSKDGARREAAEEAAADHPGRAHFQTVDVNDCDQVDAAIGEIWALHGPFTGVVDNAVAQFVAQNKYLGTCGFDRWPVHH